MQCSVAAHPRVRYVLWPFATFEQLDLAERAKARRVPDAKENVSRRVKATRQLLRGD